MTGQLHLTCEAGQRYFLTTSAAAECRSGNSYGSLGVARFSHTTRGPASRCYTSSRWIASTPSSGIGHRDSGLGFSELSRGYQTEELAASTLELIWCLDEPLTHQGDETTRSHRP